MKAISALNQEIFNQIIDEFSEKIVNLNSSMFKSVIREEYEEAANFRDEITITINTYATMMAQHSLVDYSYWIDKLQEQNEFIYNLIDEKKNELF